MNYEYLFKIGSFEYRFQMDIDESQEFSYFLEDAYNCYRDTKGTEIYKLDESQVLEFNLRYSKHPEIDYSFRLITEEEKNVLVRVLRLKNPIDKSLKIW